MTMKQILLLALLLLGVLLGQEAQAFYNPTTGRWLSRDPIGEQGGRNVAGFVGGDPVNQVDALGRYPSSINTPSGQAVLAWAMSSVIAGSATRGALETGTQLGENWDNPCRRWQLDGTRLNRAMYNPSAMAWDAVLGPLIGRGLQLWQAYAVASVYRSAISTETAAALRNAGLAGKEAIAGAETSVQSSLPYRKGVNYSFDTFNESLGTAPAPRSAPTAVGDAARTTAHTFSSTDPLVANLANKIESLYPGHVVGVNVPLRNAAGNLVTDADILLQNSVLQVKSGGSAQGLLGQQQRSEAVTGLPSIGFGPNLPANSLRTLSQQGGLVTGDESLLLQVIKP